MSGNIIGFGWGIRKLAFWKQSILDLICCPAIRKKIEVITKQPQNRYKFVNPVVSAWSVQVQTSGTWGVAVKGHYCFGLQLTIITLTDKQGYS